MKNKEEREYKNPIRERRNKRRDPLKRAQVQAKMNIAARIDDIRIEVGLSKSEFAVLLGKHPSVVTKWLSGTHNFTQDTYTLIEYKTGKKIFKEVEEKEAVVAVKFINTKKRQHFLSLENLPNYPIFQDLVPNNNITFSTRFHA